MSNVALLVAEKRSTIDVIQGINKLYNTVSSLTLYNILLRVSIELKA
jgi:hypothetical protein